LPQYHVFRPYFLVTRIGEMALQLGAFAKMREMELFNEPFTGIVFAPQNEVCNETLLNYFRPWIELARDGDPTEIPTFNAVDIRMPDGTILHEDRANVAIYKMWENEDRPPILKLTKDHRKKGAMCLKKLGVPKDRWFTVLHVRDHGFLTDSSNDFRNANIESYFKAVETIVENGGCVVRLGHPEMPPLPEMPYVFDYAHSPLRSDWMDIYLLAAARFFLGTTSGPWIVSNLFGVPVAQANNTPFSERPFSKRDIYISKLHMRDGLPVPFDEAMRPPYRNQYTDVGPLRDNTAEEINDLVVEMLKSLEGEEERTPVDLARQEQIVRLSEEFEPRGVSSRMGSAFLRDWGDLLPKA